MSTAPASQSSVPQLRILVATEYLPPYVSGIANRFKNLTNGYRDAGHIVTISSVAGTACDMVVPSVPNPFYLEQRMFAFPPLLLLWQLVNPFSPVPYDIVHLVSPLCLPFVPLIPLFKLRGVKIYVSYHVLMEYYKEAYFYKKGRLMRLIGDFNELVYTYCYFVFLVWFADVVGVPSRTADSVVYKHAPRIHYMRSGLDTDVFVPRSGTTTSATSVSESTPSCREQEPSLPYTPLSPPSSPASLASQSSPRSFSLNPPPLPPSLLSVPPPRSPDSGPTLIYVGRLAPEKNVQFLVAALAHPALASSNTKLVIVGDGPAREQLELLAAETVGCAHVYSRRSPASNRRRRRRRSSISNLLAKRKHSFASLPTNAIDDENAPPQADAAAHHRIIFTGAVLNEHKVAQHYARADVFVSASASETFGFTVAEALACGTPAVVVREGAFKTVYRLIDAWMFHEGDVDDFVEKIWTCFGDAGARTEARRLAVTHFGVGLAVEDLLGMYDQVVRGKVLESGNANG
ncbi:Sulfoquinovosyl transferase sqd2 [Geranomyces variabilis]|uniref:Sulfoquinovosyl transferase sqd2 n=1 Tax=Geranomyces variabilis TaxID=109894 RepID=A0AAD5XQQ6_9FUNG|nr:Sulfoquinovosyl transferase sqd2 [Geranomyces variabilis]